ncbi:hypothetical protein JW905_09855 [bacterium]|nr:hypothetical protein [candidate division CSSED10-310 bacterium]
MDCFGIGGVVPVVRARIPLLIAALSILAVTMNQRTGAVVVDGLAAAVEDKVICRSTVSAVTKLVRQGIIEIKTDEPSPRALLDRIIERAVIVFEMKRAGIPQLDEKAVEEEVTMRFPPGTSRAEMESIVKAAGWSWREFMEWVREDAQVARFIRERFAAFIMVTDGDVRQALAAEFPDDPTVWENQEAKGLMKHLLEERELNNRLEEWLTGVKDRYRVVYFTPPSEAGEDATADDTPG